MASIVFDGAHAAVLDSAESGPERQWRTLAGPFTCEIKEQRVAVIGANGSGKSTFLRMINGLTQPTWGRVAVDGKDTVDDGRAVRQNVGFVFTDPAAQLVMPTVIEDIELSLRRIKNKRERRERSLAVLDELGLTGLADRSVYELSGGQRQLVALASVLTVEPSVLLMDEPTTLLDLTNRTLLRDTLDELAENRGVQIITTTHDLEFAADAERALVIDDGQIAFDGPADQAIAHYREAAVSAARSTHSRSTRSRNTPHNPDPHGDD
ncbi:ABC transporter ATP-binding protein [Brevibacterium sp. HMSC24B04]|uniref:ABC transporter ATP-binding protein n=1 Tax=Brevibacterium sp. HMSC24B04 TaxID=1581060 RepID=UPI0008A44D48|nr:ABC transporter ATP-binding protein [Brevibacterium sp. HMSC24B04]OFT92798.1 cobalt ABC transporter ATP-binding protein [Brevibacterium sp. HMSC24B04]